MAQAALTAFETWLSHDWRQEERTFRKRRTEWRKEDLEHRKIDTALAEDEHDFRILKRRWREEDVRQKRLDNTRHLWTRAKEANRREVEEKATYMRSMAWLSALMAGFTMTVPVEFAFDAGGEPKQWVVTFYAVVAAIVPGFLTASAMMSVQLLEVIVKLGKRFVEEEAEEEFVSNCLLFAAGKTRHLAPPTPSKTFSKFWDFRCEADWRWTFRMFSLGVMSFFLLMGLMAFLKFIPNVWIPAVFSAPLLLSVIFWVWIRNFWGNYLTTKPKVAPSALVTRHDLCGDPFDWHIQPTKFDSFADRPQESGEASEAGTDDVDQYEKSSAISAEEFSMRSMDGFNRVELEDGFIQQ